MEDEQHSPEFLTPTTQLADLDAERLHYLENFLGKILASEVAETAFAQIVDGLPTGPSFERNTGHQPTLPEVAERKEPSPDALGVFREFRTQCHLGDLQVNLKVWSLPLRWDISM